MPFDSAQAIRICNLISDEGLTLRQTAEREGISPALIIFNAVNDPEGFAKQYARAIDLRTEREFEAFDDELQLAPPVIDGRIDPGWVNWKRLQIDTRKWILSKRVPKKYSDRVEHVGADGGPIQILSTIPRPPKEG